MTHDSMIRHTMLRSMMINQANSGTPTYESRRAADSSIR